MFLNNSVVFNGYKHTVHQIEAGYPGFQIVSIVIWLSENRNMKTLQK